MSARWSGFAEQTGAGRMFEWSHATVQAFLVWVGETYGDTVKAAVQAKVEAVKGEGRPSPFALLHEVLCDRDRLEIDDAALLGSLRFNA